MTLQMGTVTGVITWLIGLITRFVLGRAGAIFGCESRVDCIFWCSEILNHRSKNQEGSSVDWLQRKNTASLLLKKQATTSRLQDTRIHRHNIAQEEPKLQLFLHKIAQKKQRWQNDFMDPLAAIDGVRDFLFSACESAGRICTLQLCPISGEKSYGFHCCWEKHMLSIFVYMFITCICCLHNLTHLYLYHSSLQNVQVCLCVWCKLKENNATPPKNRRNHVIYKIRKKQTSHLRGFRHHHRPVVSFHWKVHQEHRSRLRAPKSPGSFEFFAVSEIFADRTKNRVLTKTTSCFKRICHK